MSTRVPIIGGNWKMNTRRSSAGELARDLAAGVAGDIPVEIAVFPPFPYLTLVEEAISEGPISLGAQNVYLEPDGAFTGEVSVGMLQDCNVTQVLAGHSERRHVLGESETLVHQKVVAALAAGLNVVLCVGETQEQRNDGQTEAITLHQVAAGLEHVTAAQMERIVIAYEPVWAIGTGLTATPDDAQAVHTAIRGHIETVYDADVANALRLQYGGSVKPGNAGELIDQPDIDGFLVGGASLDASGFLEIIHTVATRTGYSVRLP